MTLTVKKLAAEVGVKPDTIRYYERVGLLSPPARSDAGYRLYDETDVERLRFIRGAQRLGLRLGEIRELLEIRDRGRCPCGHTEALVRRRLSELDDEIARMKRLRSQLVRLAEAFPPGSCPDGEPWPCEREFIEAGRR